MGLGTSRVDAAYVQLRARMDDSPRDIAGGLPVHSPRRRAMVMLGSTVLGASLLGTIIGHLLSAPSPI